MRGIHHFVTKRKRHLSGENVVTVAMATNDSLCVQTIERGEQHCWDSNTGLYWPSNIGNC